MGSRLCIHKLCHQWAGHFTIEEKAGPCPKRLTIKNRHKGDIRSRGVVAAIKLRWFHVRVLRPSPDMPLPYLISWVSACTGTSMSFNAHGICNHTFTPLSGFINWKSRTRPSSGSINHPLASSLYYMYPSSTCPRRGGRWRPILFGFPMLAPACFKTPQVAHALEILQNAVKLLPNSVILNASRLDFLFQANISKGPFGKRIGEVVWSILIPQEFVQFWTHGWKHT